MKCIGELYFSWLKKRTWHLIIHFEAAVKSWFWLIAYEVIFRLIFFFVSILCRLVNLLGSIFDQFWRVMIRCFSIDLSWFNVVLYFWPCFFGPLFIILHSFLLQTFKHESVSLFSLIREHEQYWEGSKGSVCWIKWLLYSFFWEGGQVTFTLSIPTFPRDALTEICPIKMW